MNTPDRRPPILPVRPRQTTAPAPEPSNGQPSPDAASGWYRSWGKRAFDLLGGIVLAILLAPVMLVAAMVIAIRLGRPVLFRQPRSGKDGLPFDVIKFRTMSDQRDEHGALLPDELRLTRFGKLLRASSIDEFPQLWNVLRGDMSLVGPRPFIARYLELYTPEQRRRLEVLPGVTGRAQVNGRNAISWEEKFEHDVWYVEHVSPWVDLQILLQTILGVIRRVGISSEGQATATEFQGTPTPDTQHQDAA